MKSYVYSNKYGTLSLVPTTDFVPIASIRGKDLPEDVKFPLGTAEQIALITGNKGIQICIPYPAGKGDYQAYVLIHASSSMVAVAKIGQIDYTYAINAQQELASRGRSKAYLPIN